MRTAPHITHPQAVPGRWIRKNALLEVLRRRKIASAGISTARLGNRRLGPYEILLRKRGATDFLLLRAATGMTAAGLPPAPTIAAGSQGEEALTLPAIQQHDPVFGLSIVVVAALAALPPPGPGDATAAERQTLLATARPEGDLAARAVAPAAAGTWDWAPLQWEINSVCRTVRLLRVRQCPRCRTPADNSLKPSLSFCRRS